MSILNTGMHSSPFVVYDTWTFTMLHCSMILTVTSWSSVVHHSKGYIRVRILFYFDFFISTYVMMVKGCLVCTKFFVQNVCSHQDNYTLHRNYKGNLELALRSRNYWKKIPWYHEKNALKRGNRQTAISNDKQLLLIERIVTKN